MGKQPINNTNAWRILFVDAYEQNTKTLEKFLRTFNQAIKIEYANFSEAKEMISRQTFQMVIAELRLPELKALSLGEWVKETYPSLKILISTFHADRWIAQVVFNLNFDGLIKKQAQPLELVTAIANLIDGEKYFNAESQIEIMQEQEPLPYYYKKLKEILKDVYPFLVRGFKTESIASKLQLDVKLVEEKMKEIFLITGTASIVQLIQYNYSKEHNHLMIFEDMMRYRSKSYLEVEPKEWEFIFEKNKQN